MLRLLSLLQSRRDWSGTELAERLGVTGRTVRRDVERLRGLGYPVRGATGTAGGYQLAYGKNLPPLLLDDDEAVAVAVGLRTAAGGSVTGIEESSVRALAKLEQVLPPRLRAQVAAVAGATVPMAHGEPGPQADSATLTTVATACRDHEYLAFDYVGRDGEATARRVEPHGVVIVYARWYLVAFDPDRDDWRSFRVDRISRPTPARRHFNPRALPDADLASYLARTFAAASYRYTAWATVYAPAEQVMANMLEPIPGTVQPRDERSCTVRLSADSLDLVTRYLVSMGAAFTVDGPAPLLEHLHTVGQRLLRASE